LPFPAERQLLATAVRNRSGGAAADFYRSSLAIKVAGLKVYCGSFRQMI
jgi:hypothetical protein